MSTPARKKGGSRSTSRGDRLVRLHPTTVVSPSAEIGEGVTIGPYSVIGEHVSIGAGTSVGSHVVIDGWTEIGRDVSRALRFGVTFGASGPPQDRALGFGPIDLKKEKRCDHYENNDQTALRLHFGS